MSSAFGAQPAQQRRRILSIFIALIFGCLLSFMLNLIVGSHWPSWQQLASIFTPHNSSYGTSSIIMFDIRLPYASMALIIGAALGLAGAELQTTLHNPLSSPFTLGFSAAGACGASLFILADIHLSIISDNTALALCALGGCLLCALLLHLLLARHNYRSETIILYGIALLFSFQTITALAQFLANEDSLQNIVFWNLGNLSRPSWPQPWICLLILLIMMGWSYKNVHKMTLLTMGDAHAQGLGINVAQLRAGALIRVSILCAISVAFTGIIGFIGLIAPHIARLLVGDNHIFYLPTSILCGALTLSVASNVGQWISTGMIMPTSIITALIGVPCFLYLILRHD